MVPKPIKHPKPPKPYEALGTLDAQGLRAI
jgi:hypothetical protein